MKIYIYEEIGRYIHDRLPEVVSQIAEKAGSDLSIEFIAVNEELKQYLDKWSGESDLACSILAFLGDDTSEYRLFIAARENSKFKNWCKDQCGHAGWGCSTFFISVDYAPEDKVRLENQLHECLHLLGVDDCYEDSYPFAKKPSCTSVSCVMQYGVVTTNVCEQVLAQIQQG